MPDCLLAFSTCPDADSARRIAHVLVAERLAACVNCLPGVNSIYRWQDKVEETDEVLLLIKTTTARIDALRTRLVALHPYATPEFIAVPVSAGLPAYLDWLQAAVVASPRPQDTF